MNPPNLYAPPRAEVADLSATEEVFQPVKVWSARGRIGRLRYLCYQGVAYLSILVIAGVGGFLSAKLQSPLVLTGAMLVSSVPYFVLTVLLTIQRCHDLNWTGWASVLAVIPLVGLLFWVMPGTQGSNRFGAPPPPNDTRVQVLAWGALFLAIVVLFIVGVTAYEGYQQRARAAQAQ